MNFENTFHFGLMRELRMISVWYRGLMFSVELHGLCYLHDLGFLLCTQSCRYIGGVNNMFNKLCGNRVE